jgi:hypothetical protein
MTSMTPPVTTETGLASDQRKTPQKEEEEVA